MKYTHADPTANTAIANVDRERRRQKHRDAQSPSHRQDLSPAVTNPAPKHAGRWHLAWSAPEQDNNRP